MSGGAVRYGAGRVRAAAGALALAALLLSGPGCSDPAGPHAGVARDLADARSAWEADGHDAYEFEMAWICYCPPELLATVRVRVESGAVVRVTRLDDGLDVPSDELDSWRSVEGLFDLVQEAIDVDAHALEASFDATTGLPLDVWIDYDRTIADEELGFTAEALRDLR